MDYFVMVVRMQNVVLIVSKSTGIPPFFIGVHEFEFEILSFPDSFQNEIIDPSFFSLTSFISSLFLSHFPFSYSYLSLPPFFTFINVKYEVQVAKPESFSIVSSRISNNSL